MEQNNQNKPRTNRWVFATQIGFFAGIIWGAVRFIEYFFEFTRVLPSFLIRPFLTATYAKSVYGHFWGLLAFIVMSMIAALIYAALLRKVKGPWPGVLYGLVWWAILYLWIGPLMGMMKWIDKLDSNSIITDLCLFAVWGLFIGYSITVEFTDERIREPFKTSTAK